MLLDYWVDERPVGVGVMAVVPRKCTSCQHDESGSPEP